MSDVTIQDLQEEHQQFLTPLGDWQRTHMCGDLSGKAGGESVCLMGWVQTRRDHGGVIFVDLRDRCGVTQIVFSPDVFAWLVHHFPYPGPVTVERLHHAMFGRDALYGD